MTPIEKLMFARIDAADATLMKLLTLLQNNHPALVQDIAHIKQCWVVEVNKAHTTYKENNQCQPGNSSPQTSF